jgi:hypothetical protein
MPEDGSRGNFTRKVKMNCSILILDLHFADRPRIQVCNGIGRSLWTEMPACVVSYAL